MMICFNQRRPALSLLLTTEHGYFRTRPATVREPRRCLAPRPGKEATKRVSDEQDKGIRRAPVDVALLFLDHLAEPPPPLAPSSPNPISSGWFRAVLFARNVATFPAPASMANFRWPAGRPNVLMTLEAGLR